MKPISLKKNFVWTFTGQASVAFAQFLIVAILARQYSAELLGEYAFALAICSPIVTLAALRLRSVQAADSLGEFTFPDYLVLRVLSLILATILIGIVAISVRGWNDSASVIIILGSAKCIDSLGDVIHGFHQRHERMDRVSVSFISRSVTMILFFGTGMYLSGSLLGGVIGVLVSSVAVVALVDLPLWRLTNSDYGTGDSRPQASAHLVSRVSFQMDPKQINKLFRLSLPLGFTSTVSSFSTNIPRYFLEYFRGTSTVGVYAALIYPLTAGSMIMSAIAQSAAPRLANHYRNGEGRLFQSFLLRLILMGAAIGVGGVVLVLLTGEILLKALYGIEYAKYQWILTWAMANAAITYCYLFLGSALNAMRLFTVQLPIHLTSMIVLTGACWFLIRPYGIEGAMASITIANAIEAILYGTIVTRRIRRDKSSPSVRWSEA